MIRRAAALLSILAGSCTSPPAPPNDAIQTRGDTDSGPITDVGDTCGMVKAGCPGLEDDGCPEVMIEAAEGCDHERTRRWIGELVQQMKAEPRFTRVAVRGDPNLASCVAGRVTAAGIDASRVEAQNDKLPYVSFEVVAWDGAACR